METKGTRNLTLPARIFMAFACACMTAFTFTVAGSYGWGEMLVGATLIFFIYAFFGNRRKMNYESIPIGIILFGLTVGEIKTFSNQMSGYLSSDVPFKGAEEITKVAIGPYSELVIMLLLGFGLIPLFSIFIGSLFSKREYKIWEYAAIIAVFCVVSIGFQFSASHYILPKIMPQAAENFKLGLADNGIDLSPMRYYIKNLGIFNANVVPFGKFYFAAIVAISKTAATLVCSIVALIIFKDKITGFVSFGINLVSSLAITVASVPLMADSDRGLLANRCIPAFFTADKTAMWRFFTGFLLGFGIMLVLVCLPKKILDGEGKYKEKSFFSKEYIRYIYGSAFILLLPFGILILSPLGLRISSMLAEMNKTFLSDSAIHTALSIIAISICLSLGKKNYLDKGLQIPLPMRCENFCIRVLPVYLFFNALIYFFTGTDRITTLPLAEMRPFASFKVLFFNGTLSVAILTIAAFILFFILFFTAKKLTKVEKKK